MAPDEVRMPNAASLPPRHSLPRDVVIPSLPGLGVTWYDRSSGYWLRRAGLAFMWAVLAGLMTFIVVAILAAIHRRSQAGFIIALVIEIAYSAGLLAFFAVRTAAHWNDPAPAGPGRRRGASGAAGARRGPLGGLGHAAGQVFLAFSFLFVGLYLALFITALLPETLVERRSRLRVAGELRARGYAPPAGAGG